MKEYHHRTVSISCVLIAGLLLFFHEVVAAESCLIEGSWSTTAITTINPSKNNATIVGTMQIEFVEKNSTTTSTGGTVSISEQVIEKNEESCSCDFELSGSYVYTIPTNSLNLWSLECNKNKTSGKCSTANSCDCNNIPSSANWNVVWSNCNSFQITAPGTNVATIFNKVVDTLTWLWLSICIILSLMVATAFVAEVTILYLRKRRNRPASGGVNSPLFTS